MCQYVIFFRSDAAGVLREVIEQALARQREDKAEAAYARGTLFDKRRSLMAECAGFCATAA